MTPFLYSAGIAFLRFTYGAASLFSSKARAFRQGRISQAPQWRESFRENNQAPLVWIHCASLGEFEQGRPVIEALKAWRPDLNILLTFFSPSGYEVRKHYPLATRVLYLPWDTPSNAAIAVDFVRPSLVIFVKYEFWYHYSTALKMANVPLISISAIFRPDHVYFKPRSAFFRNILGNFSRFFVQNEESVRLLQSIGIKQVSLAGDTRFDRVGELADRAEENPIARSFKGSQKVIVVGSAWPLDMDVLLPFLNEHLPGLKVIIAPHEPMETFLRSVEKSIKGKCARYTKTTEYEVSKANVLLIDTIGLLTQLYRYGDYAFVGGGFKEGLHNTLEAACYGVPVFFGSRARYDKYQEAIDLVRLGGAFAVANTAELRSAFEALGRGDALNRAGEAARSYVRQNRGATAAIVSHCKSLLEAWKGA